jgi:hypothetical protein
MADMNDDQNQRTKSLFTELDEAIDHHKAKKKAEDMKQQREEKAQRDAEKKKDNPLL